MKPHLPVSLFRALITAVASFPVFAFGGLADIPADYSQIHVSDVTDVAGDQMKAAFLFKMSAATWNPAYNLFSNSAKSVLFTSWDSTNRTTINMSGAATQVLRVGDLTFVDLSNINIDSNAWSVDSKINTAIMGAPICVGSPVLSTEPDTEGDFIGFANETNTLTFSANRNIYLTRNSISLKVAPDENPLPIRKGSAMGAAMAAVNLNLIGNKNLTLEGNTATADVSGKAGTIATAMGGALFGENITISNNEDVVIQGNRVRSISASQAMAHGGALAATNQITIVGNSSVSIRNNAVYRKYKVGNDTKELYYLEGVSIQSGNKGLLSVSAGNVASVTFYDPINVDCNVSINTDYENALGQQEAATGNVVFSGKYIVDDLTNFRKDERGPEEASPSTEELDLSFSSTAMGTTTLHHGKMTICDEAVYNTGAFVSAEGGASTLALKKGTLISRIYADMLVAPGNGSTTFGRGTNLHLQSTGNTIKAQSIAFNGNNTLTFDLSALNISSAGVQFISENGVTFSEGTVIYLNSDTRIADGIYKLITMDEKVTLEGWTSANVSVSGSADLGFTATYANLRWKTENGQTTLYYHTTLPLLTDATWSNTDGDYIWSLNSINWTQDAQPYAFSNGAIATFTDVGAEKPIIIEGEIRPSSVLVDNSTAADYEWIASTNGGSLAGEMTLTKRGDGNLKVSLANDYTGGTFVEAGTLTAGHEQAFGTGDITVKGGHLNTDTYAVQNSVLINSGRFSGTAYAGQLTVTGTATFSDDATAAAVILKAAEITGGSLTNTKITSEDSIIGTMLTGKTDLTVIGNTTLKGNHTSTGTITVQNGMLALEGTSTTNFDLQGGSLNPTTPIVLGSGQEVKFNGGNIQGSLETTADSQVTIATSSSISSDFTLNGGTITPGGYGTILKVGSELNILSTTTFDVNNYISKGSYTLITATQISDGVDMLTAITNTRNTNTLDVKDNSLVLIVQENAATLYWKADEDGVWGGHDYTSQEWDTDAEDARFFDRDEVVFDAGGSVDIQGTVKPSQIRVEGTKNVTFSGTGSIAGETGIHKIGSNTLIMNATNTYEGDTVIEDGTVKAGGDGSFGSGNILLKNGTLNLGDYAVGNAITASGGELEAATAYKGKLSVIGDIMVGDNTTAGSIALESGVIDGGSIKNTAITASGPSGIMSSIKGTSSITVEASETVLSGRNSFTGDITIKNGQLTIARSESLGAGDIYLNGGMMKANPGVVLALSGKQKLHFNGGQFSGNLRTANDTSVVLNNDATITGNLRLKGGSLLFNGKKNADAPVGRSMIMTSNGCTLTITGELALSAGTMVVLEKGQYADGDILMEAGSLTGDFGQLILDYDDGNPHTEYTLALQKTNDKVQIMLDLDKVYEHTNGKWNIANGELRDLLVQSNWGIFSASHAFTDAMQGQRSASGPVGDKGVMVWASALYNHMSVDDDGVKNGADSDTLGAAVGVESMIGSRSCIGMAVGVTSTDISVNGIADEMEQDGTYIGFYGATVLTSNEISGLTLSWSAAYGSVDSSPSRAASSIEWQQDSFQLNGRLDWSRSISDRTTVNLFAGLEYFATTSDEVAGVDSGDISNLRAELGAGITRRYASSVLYAEARLLGDIMRDDPTPSINGWSEEGANPGTVGAGFRVGAACDINQYWSLGVNGSLEILGGTVSAGANVGASLKF